ncbi:hypothetical protein Nepgr_023498 [Nepenthes gracilis]|uniref:SBP-type domain-containing protein n=1 Tax=Nepenthes gracilis TaxID=150966 RepID=A0AAD3T2Z0_NEPGR|nr:hypothetical protein Nepgr_023498 [Nepenthes gracilis]
MLGYEWDNTAPIILAGDESNHCRGSAEDHHARQVIDPYAAHAFVDGGAAITAAYATAGGRMSIVPSHSALFPYNFDHRQQAQANLQSFLDPRVFGSHCYQPPPPSVLSLDTLRGATAVAAGPTDQFMLIPKAETGLNLMDYPSRIGLNLGGRTYFSADDDFVSRLYRRSRSESFAVNLPRCQAQGCNADLSHAKHYHRRHKVCEFHSKASTVIAAGLTQRFCQQCSRFHLLTEFDNGKRSCRKRLADHNRRRRKFHQSAPQDARNPQLECAPNSSSENHPSSSSRRYEIDGDIDEHREEIYVAGFRRKRKRFVSIQEHQILSPAKISDKKSFEGSGFIIWEAKQENSVI